MGLSRFLQTACYSPCSTGLSTSSMTVPVPVSMTISQQDHRLTVTSQIRMNRNELTPHFNKDLQDLQLNTSISISFVRHFPIVRPWTSLYCTV